MAESRDRQLYELTISSFKDIGCMDVEGCLDRMIALDFIIADEDDRYISARNFKEPKQDVEKFYARKIAQAKHN